MTDYHESRRSVIDHVVVAKVFEHNVVPTNVDTGEYAIIMACRVLRRNLIYDLEIREG